MKRKAATTRTIHEAMTAQFQQMMKTSMDEYREELRQHFAEHGYGRREIYPENSNHGHQDEERQKRRREKQPAKSLHVHQEEDRQRRRRDEQPQNSHNSHLEEAESYYGSRSSSSENSQRRQTFQRRKRYILEYCGVYGTKWSLKEARSIAEQMKRK
ncbi:unnamed protein product [Brassica oleracea var. botrytis]|uniref:(rape) hypothetical protein n=1 Tax=Brassica napus TaxID=3708 RepID=A0A078GGF7_BRANA|nr:unnamed protein product [Brassica napus]CDY23703.1 BnaC01g24180D [Brassica napus]